MAFLLRRKAFMKLAGRPPRLAGGGRPLPIEGMQRLLRSDHALLVEGLQVPDHLGNYPDQLAGDVSDILLGQLPLLLAPAKGSAERRLELRPTKRRSEILQRVAQRELAKTLLAKTLLAIALLAEASLANALLAKSKAAAFHRPVLRLRLALQHSHDLRHD